MAEDQESSGDPVDVSAQAAQRLLSTEVAGFRTAVTRLVLDAAYIAVFLVLEWGLTTLVRLTLGVRSSGGVGEVINIIQIGSAVVAALFFALHFVGALVRYSMHLIHDLGES